MRCRPLRWLRTKPTASSASRCLVTAWRLTGICALTRDVDDGPASHNRVTIRRSVGGGTPPGYDRVPARLLSDGLMVVTARVGGVRVDAVIDTGSERSIANNALREALAWRRRRGEIASVTDVYGATSEVALGEIQVAPTIDFGRVKIANVTLVFGNFHIFQVWGMESRPAIIIGMDVLGTVNALAIDFQRSELYIDSVFHLG